MARPRTSRSTAAPRRRLVWTAGAAVALVLAIAVAWSLARRPGRTTAPAPPAGADRGLAALDLAGANQRAIELVQAHRFLESIPYFRREFELLPQPVGGLHHDFGTVLHNAAFQNRQLRGLAVAATRGTIERVALVREALAHQERAVSLASDRFDQAGMSERRAHMLWQWGFRWDAYADYGRALEMLPGSRAVAARIALRVAQMCDPVHVTAADEDQAP